MRRFGVLLLGLLAGCATDGPYPAYVAGNYYMGGDADCVRYDVVGGKRIRCVNAKGQMTGYRDAMTPQQMQMYQMAQQSQPSTQVAYVPQSMPVVSYPTMQTPQVAPITPPGGNQVRCVSTGFYTNCR